MGHQRTQILALALPQLAEGPGQVPSLLGFPFFTQKANGVELDHDVSWDFFRLCVCSMSICCLNVFFLFLCPVFKATFSAL